MADNYVGISIRATDGAKPQLDELKLKLDELKDRVAEARVHVEDKEANARLDEDEAKLEAISKRIASPRIDIAGAARARAQLDEVDLEMDKVEHHKSPFAGAGAAMSMALLGIGAGAAVAVKAAGNFQDATTHLVTDAGESAANLGMVQRGILAVSAATATSAAEITDGMYHVESSGLHGAAGLAVLKVAAEGAKVGGAELDTVSKALTGTLNAYGQTSDNSAKQTSMATSMMNQLIKTVGAGDMRMQDLASSLGNVAPVAAAAKISFAQIGGALSTMTAQNMSAQQATQDLRHTIMSIESPNKVAQKELAGLGLSAKDLSSNLGRRGLASTMQMVSDAARKHAGAMGQTYTQAMYKAMGGTTGLTTALMLTGSRMATFKGNAATIAEAAKKGGGAVDDWSKIQGTFNFKLNSAKTAVENTGIALGSALLPSVTAVLTPLSKFLAGVASSKTESLIFAGVIGSVVAGALGSKLAGALGSAKEGIGLVVDGVQGIPGAVRRVGTIASSLGSAASSVVQFGATVGKTMARAVAATAVWIAEHAAATAAYVAENAVQIASAMAAFVAENLATLGIVAGIALLVAAIIWLATHWKQVWAHIKQWALDAWHFIDNDVIHPIMNGVHTMVTWIEQHWRMLVMIVLSLLGPVGFLVGYVITHFHQIEQGASHLVGAVENFFKSLPHRILSALGDLGSLLFSSGEKIIMGLIHGIESMIGSVGSTMSSIVSEVKSYLPFSPAKKGPLSGSGAPENSGRSIARLLARGITSGTPDVQRAMAQVTHTVQSRPGGAGLAAGGGGQLTVTLEFAPGMDSELMRGLRNYIRVKGGNVQRVLGAGAG